MQYFFNLLFKVLFFSLIIIYDSYAHSLTNNSTGFGSGFSHPILGLDHFLAMLGVGIWGAQMGGRQIWSLPISFPIIMCVGAIISISNILTLRYEEYIIALSVVLLGAFIFCNWKTKEIIALMIISFIAIFHGYAHGSEIPKAIDPASFIIGFVISTGLIHVIGVLLGYTLINIYHGIISKLLGILISVIGVFLLISL
jgi:urease accessory protein